VETLRQEREHLLLPESYFPFNRSFCFFWYTRGIHERNHRYQRTWCIQVISTWFV